MEVIRVYDRSTTSDYEDQSPAEEEHFRPAEVPRIAPDRRIAEELRQVARGNV